MSFGGKGTGSGSIGTDSDVALSNVANGDILQYDAGVAKWENQAGSSGTQVKQLGDTGSAITLADPATYGMQVATLTANTVITMPSATSGASFTLILIQDSTGGRTWGFAGSVAYPAGAPNPLSSAGASNIMVCECWDGATWNVFPATSSATAVSATALDITGGVSGAGGLRIVGSQSTGSAPTYSSPQVDDVVLDSALPGWWVCTTGGSSPVWQKMSGGGSDGSGISVTSPNAFNQPNYNATGSDWVATQPRYYDITKPPFNVSTTATDNSSAINTALSTLGPLGIISYLPPGTYNVAAPIVIGNANTGGNTTANQNFTGPADSVSTWTATFEGAAPTQGYVTKQYNSNPAINPSLSETHLLWTGGNNYAGAMVVINGPISSASLKNLHFDGNSSYTNGPSVGMSVLSSRESTFENLAFDNVVCGIILSTVTCANAKAVNCVYNIFRNIQVVFDGNGGGAKNTWGLMLTAGAGGAGPGGNSCYNTFYECYFITLASNFYSIVFQGCDSNRVYNVNAHVIAYDYGATCPIPANILPQGKVTGNTNGGMWPAGCKVYDIEQGGNSAAAVNLGSPAVSFASPNEIHHTNVVNGPSPNPFLANLKWNSENLAGTGTLVNGVFTLPTWVTNFIKNGVIGGSPASTCYLKAYYTSLAATPGPTGALVPSISTNGSTATITSYTGSSVNTADNNNIGWELIYS